MFEDHPLVRFAVQQVGGLDAALDDLPKFLEVLGETIEVIDQYTKQLGLSVGQITDLIATVRLYEPAAEGARHAHRNVCAQQTKDAVTSLYLRGLDAPVIALLLGLDEAAVADFLGRRQVMVAEREIVHLHLRGLTPNQISQQIAVARSTADATIRRAGETPNNPRCELGELRARIVELRQGGASYGEIRERTGARTNQIRNAIRWAQGKGLLPKCDDRQASDRPGIRLVPA